MGKKYIKILKKDFKQIKEVLNPENGHSAHHIITEITKNIIPELFEDKNLKPNNWYKHKIHSGLVYYSEIIEEKYITGYGFTSYLEYWDKVNYYKNQLVPASKKEVFDALKNEAIKRGYQKGRECLFGLSEEKRKLETNDFYLRDYRLCINDNNNCGDVIFQDGKWAELAELPTLTKIEAEEKYSIKIID